MKRKKVEMKIKRTPSSSNLCYFEGAKTSKLLMQNQSSYLNVQGFTQTRKY
jgi:hypothetical protein